MPDGVSQARFAFDNSFAREMPGFYADVAAAHVPAPRLFRLNRSLARDLGLDPDTVSDAEAAAIFSGQAVPPGAHPIAQAYAGHQFGGFSPQLGDGRALILGELIDRAGHRRDLALKGSGITPFSRRGDGKAALGPVLREYLVGEAMHALGIPTTRALAAVTTGETVLRDTALPGAVLTRVASSHIRVGTFQFFAARGETEKVAKLARYTAERHYPETRDAAVPALALLESVIAAQARLLARWMAVGFVHGVMNTDNMALSGETIDYGPCAFLDAYDPATVFSSIDHAGRYAFGNQPGIAQWNLARFAETLLPLIDVDPDRAIALATEKLMAFASRYEEAWLGLMRAKLGLFTAEPGDLSLVQGLLAAMQTGAADWTLTFRRLSRAAQGDPGPFLVQFADPSGARTWLAGWQARIAREPQQVGDRMAGMNGANPAAIPRNHMVEAALSAAAEADAAPFEALLAAITDPFNEAPGREAFLLPAPAAFAAGFRTFCGT